MLSHVHIGVRQFEAALELYGAVMGELGWRLRFVDRERPWAGWQPSEGERPLLLIGRPYDGGEAAPGNGHMVALLAPSREAVDRAYAAALAHGGRDEGPPGPRPEYHADYYGAYFRDPDGNKVCVCHHAPG